MNINNFLNKIFNNKNYFIKINDIIDLIENDIIKIYYPKIINILNYGELKKQLT